MGKVFNDQIIKILCAKNSTKKMGEPNLCSENTPLRRGESYVVFLNQMQRDDLNQRNEQDPLNVALCKVRRCSSCAMGHSQALRVNRNFDSEQQRKYWARTKSLSRRLSENIQTVGRYFMGNICMCNILKDYRPEIDTDRVIPPVFGPFVDECICAAVDRLFYLFHKMMGSILQPLDEAD